MVGFPLLLIPLAIYNIVVFLMPGVQFDAALFTIPMPSGVEWPVNFSDILLAVGMVLLLLEVVKGARPGAKYLMDHLLSLIVFGAAAAEFVLWPKFANSTFFLLTLLAMVDLFTGIAQRTRRRVVVAEATPVARRSRRAVAVEPEPEPAPAQEAVMPPARPAASAQSVAESVLMEHPEPSPPPVAHPEEIPSPGLQPGNGHPPPEAPRP